jgi:hypothetical protein
MKGTAAMEGIAVVREGQNTKYGSGRERSREEGVAGQSRGQAVLLGDRAGCSHGRCRAEIQIVSLVDGHLLKLCASGSDHISSPPIYNPLPLLPWPNPSPSYNPPSKTIVPCPLLPTPHSTPPPTPAPSLVPPTNGVLALSVTVIVTFPVHPPVSS